MDQRGRLVGLLITSLLVLLACAAIVILTKPHVIKASWDYTVSVKYVAFEYPRAEGGVVLATHDWIRWLDANGKLIKEQNIKPDEFFFPQVFHNKTYSGTKSGAVLAFDSNGNQLWKATPFSNTCSVAINDRGESYAISTVKKGAEKDVAVLADDGTLVNRIHLKGRLAGWPAPLITASGLIVGDHSPHGSPYTRANLAAYDSKGKLAWSTLLGGFNVQDIVKGPNSTVYCVAHQNRVFCVDTKIGKPKWSFIDPYPPLSGSSLGWYEIYGLQKDRILIASSGRLFCLSSDGKTLWHRNMHGGVGACVQDKYGNIFTTVGKTAVPYRWQSMWRNYQLQRGNLNSKFPLPTFNSSYLVRLSENGKPKTVGQLDNNNLPLLFGIGSHGELYGWTVDYGQFPKPSTYHIRRIDP